MWIGTTLVILLVIIGAIACHTPTMNDVIQSAPSFRGTVMDVTDASVLVMVAEDEEESQTSDTIWVSLDVELEDGRITCYEMYLSERSKSMDNGASSYRRFRDDGDESGLAEIIRNYRDGLIFYLNSFVGNIHIAEELAEDTFVLLGIKKPKDI